MIGAIAGDISGSVYEFDPIKTKDFPLFSLSATSRMTQCSPLLLRGPVAPRIDIGMLVVPGGQERNEAEYHALFRQSRIPADASRANGVIEAALY